jgi:hypothetical protein
MCIVQKIGSIIESIYALRYVFLNVVNVKILLDSAVIKGLFGTSK